MASRDSQAAAVPSDLTLMQGQNAADISNSPRVQRLAVETRMTPGSLHQDAVEWVVAHGNSKV